MNLTGDFHVHTNYCPHGSEDSMESYVLAALDKGLKFLTFTEHAPLPKRFTDPTPEQDSAMRWEDVKSYFAEANRLKEKYKEQITISLGFEVDYIEGFEQETKELLDHLGPDLDDSILSIHMLKAPSGEYVCIDFSAEEFERIIGLFGSVDDIYDCYYKTVEQALSANLGEYKPSRIGHLTLIEKFSKIHKPQRDYRSEIITLLNTMKEKKLVLDANTAGFYKEFCQACYPSMDIMTLASEMGIPLVFGSDSHTSDHIGRGVKLLPSAIELSLPNNLLTE